MTLQRLNSGWTFEGDNGLDDLFAESSALPQPSLAANVEALLRLAINAAAQREASLEHDLQAARDHGWSSSELEHTLKLARQAGAGRPPAEPA